MIERNPMRHADIRAKAATALRARGWKPPVRGGNGKGPTAPQLALAAAKQIEDRVFGQAKQVVETQEDTRTPEEIRADIERKKREAGIE